MQGKDKKHIAFLIMQAAVLTHALPLVLKEETGVRTSYRFIRLLLEELNVNLLNK